MKKSIVWLLILLDIVIILFIPMIPVKLIGGMMDNGNVYIRKFNLTISDCIAQKLNPETADAFYNINWTIFVIYILIFIVFNIVICVLAKKVSKKHKKNSL